MIIKKGVVFSAIILTIFLIGIISGSFTKGEPKYSIEKEYGQGDGIRGWVNLSLNNEPGDSVLKSSCEDINGQIKLVDLVKKSSNANFLKTCDTTECVSNYEAEDAKPFKTHTLTDNSVVFGFKISPSKNIVDILAFSLNVTSNATESEKLPLSIDILDDGDIEWQAHNSSDNLGSAVYGCYVGSAEGQAVISTDKYCERINISQAPAVNISAMVSGSGNVNFTLSIENKDGSNYKSCTANISATGEVGCSPDFHINEKKDYFVCIKAKTSADAKKNYMINFEQNTPCGFVGIYSNEYTRDFEIYVKPKKYAALRSFILNDTELKNSGSETHDIEGMIADYIYEKYSNNCTKGCIIPVKFTGFSQEINLSEASLKYKSDATDYTTDLYNLTEIAAKITTTKFQKLYMDDAGFNVPEDYGNYTCSFELNDNDLFSEKISVTMSVPSIRSFNPRKTAKNYPTHFVVEINSTGNITEYKWDFGNGDVKTTSTNRLTYTYNTTGVYDVKITVKNSKDKSSSRTFSVTVVLASEVVPDLLLDAEVNIESIKEQIKEYASFEQKGLNYSLNISSLESIIARLKSEQAQASKEEDYEAILDELIDIHVPIMIATTITSGSLIFYPESNNINLAVLKDIAGGNYTAGKDEQYAEAVLGWEGKNTNTTLIYNQISSIYDDYDEPLLNIFEIKIKKESTAGNPYLIIKKMNNMIFEGNITPSEKSGYYYFQLTEQEKKVKFSTTDEVDFINVPMFVSPKISELSLQDTGWSPYDEKGELKKWILFAIIIVALIVFGLILWIVLQLWYKKRYEDHLFKNKNNLYNLVNYIEQAKARGMNERDIVVKLRKSGWTNEQLRYAMRKYAGKRTGMLEIPIDKLFEKGK